jgi:hypothetical protein
MMLRMRRQRLCHLALMALLVDRVTGFLHALKRAGSKEGQPCSA